jgi:tetratricopeptide (TPR) repeat protein
MLKNRWAGDYVKALFEMSGKGPKDLRELVDASGLRDIEDPLLEIGFLRQSGQAIRGFNLAVAELALCRENAPEGLVADLIETVEHCNRKILSAKEELPKLREAVDEDPNNGEKLAHLGFGLNALDDREAALTAFTRALEHPESVCIHCHRDCLNNIGWDHYLRGEYEQALGWFEHACQLKQPLAHVDDDKHLGNVGEAELDVPYRLALENILLALAKMGRLTEATTRLQEYHGWFGRLPTYESRALEKLGLQPDVIYMRFCIEKYASEPKDP